MKKIIINEGHLKLFEGLEDNMSPTKQWMEQKFKLFNNELFNGFLPKCKLAKKKLSGNYLGVYSTHYNQYKELVTPNDFVKIANPTIYLTTMYNAPEYVWENVLIHEMCHYYTQFDEEGNARAIDNDNDGHGADFFNAVRMVSNASGGKYEINRIVSAEHYKKLGYETKDRPFSKMKGTRLIRTTFANNGISAEAFIMTNNEFIAKQILNMSADKRILVTDNKTLVNILIKSGYKIYSPYTAKNAIYIVNPAIKELFDKCKFIEFGEGDF